MRRRYLVTYDVSDAKRLRRTYRALHGFGDPVQYSVFVCDLSAVERQLMLEKLTAILNLWEDRVLVVDLGATGGARTAGFTVLGRQIEVMTDDFKAWIV